MAWVVMAAFKTKPEFFGSPWRLPDGLHWQNFVDAFVIAKMGIYFTDSLFVTVLGLVFSLSVAIPAAYAIARVPFRGRALVEGFLMAGLFINVNYIVVPIFLMLLGWDQALASWLPNGFFIDNLAVLALVYAATSLPFTVYLLVSFFPHHPCDLRGGRSTGWVEQTAHNAVDHGADSTPSHLHGDPVQLPELLERLHHLSHPHPRRA
ncbi:ABC-type sugar transport system [Cutibacterium acnes JCM 18918]|nr:ABC-type sugar transport system [Cutibacterium acnes JCM 18918]